MKENTIPRRILVVDDEEKLRLLYQYELEEDNYRVELAANAKEAFDILEKTVVDLIIMDVKMPGVTGIEATQKIAEKRGHAPIIINSGYPHFKHDCMTWLAEDYVVKSANLRELKAKIKQVLGESKNNRLISLTS